MRQPLPLARDPAGLSDSRGSGRPELVVGFDLDLTLLDTRPGIASSMTATAERLDVPIDVAAVISRLGISLADELANWVPAERLAEAVAVYRTIYRDLGPRGSSPLPGAPAALAAVRAHGGRLLVVTAKRADLAADCLAEHGIEVDEVIGDLVGRDKGVALRERGAAVYVGDHPLDILGARAAGAAAVAVATGEVPAADLADADVVLPDLTTFPAWLDDHVLTTRLAALERRLAEAGSLLVAFSGGADSALLLACAARVLGPERVVAATAVSASLPAAELAAAAEVAAGLGVRHVTARTDEMSREGYRANAGDRCFFCKAELMDTLAPLAAELGLAYVATGTNADDAAAGFRPGIRAAAERGALTPLLDAGLTKAQVRAASHRLGLPTADKPAAACLSSRIAYGIPVSTARLARVEAAEVALRAALAANLLPVRDLRVRDLGDVARIEVDADLVATLSGRPDLLASVKGFDVVEVDPRGFRSGSMNEALIPGGRPPEPPTR